MKAVKTLEEHRKLMMNRIRAAGKNGKPFKNCWNGNGWFYISSLIENGEVKVSHGVSEKRKQGSVTITYYRFI